MVYHGTKSKMLNVPKNYRLYILTILIYTFMEKYKALLFFDMYHGIILEFFDLAL